MRAASSRERTRLTRVRAARRPRGDGLVPPASGRSGTSGPPGSRFARLNARPAMRTTPRNRRIGAAQAPFPRSPPRRAPAAPPVPPEEGPSRRGSGREDEREEAPEGDPARDGGREERGNPRIERRVPPFEGSPRDPAEHVEHPDRREGRRAAQGDDDRHALRVEDLLPLVRELVVDPLAALVDALHEARVLELFEVFEEGRLAEPHEVAQVGDRLAPLVEGLEEARPDVGGEGLEARLVQGDLGRPRHPRAGRCPWGLLKASPRFGESLTTRRATGSQRGPHRGTFFQSSRNRFSPTSVRECWVIFFRTSKGIVTTSAPSFAASITWSGCRMDATRTSQSQS